MIPYKDLNSPRSFPWMTLLLILINIAVFGYQITLPQTASIPFLYQYAAIPLEFKLGQNLLKSIGPPPVFTLMTAQFLHGGLLHLLGNMLYLWIFGNTVESQTGRMRFLFFYLLCGVCSILFQVYANFSSRIPIIGASGAIAGVLGAYMRYSPRAKIGVFVPIFYFLRSVILPAWLVLGGWFLLQVISARFSHLQETSGEAYYAHIGGFIVGLVLFPAFQIMRQKRQRKRS